MPLRALAQGGLRGEGGRQAPSSTETQWRHLGNAITLFIEPARRASRFGQMFLSRLACDHLPAFAELCYIENSNTLKNFYSLPCFVKEVALKSLRINLQVELVL